jgi:hypothetical protein
MPKSKRPPIAYKPQFAGDIFRPKEVVDAELGDAPPEHPVEVEVEPKTERPSSRTTGRTNERSTDRTTGRPDDRVRIRHSFDVYQDQLVALGDIQIAAFRRSGRKPPIGELVQAALDEYIDKTTGRTFERTTGRRR